VSRGRSILIGGGAACALAIGTVTLWEGRSLDAYQDIVGVWTICDGDTRNVRAGQKATNKECDERLIRELIAHESGMLKCVTRPLPPKVHVAFLSLTYNIGVTNFCSSTLAKKANAGDFVGACNELLKWNRAGGRFVQGLANRRAYEQRICLEGAA
jgi:lysozyme